MSIQEFKLFHKDYDGESICDYSRDISECLDPKFNSDVNEMEVDKHGFFKGIITIEIYYKHIKDGEG